MTVHHVIPWTSTHTMLLFFICWTKPVNNNQVTSWCISFFFPSSIYKLSDWEVHNLKATSDLVHVRSKQISARESTSVLPAVRKAWCWWLGGRAGSSWGSQPPPTSWSPRGSSPSPGWRGSSSARCPRFLQWSWRSQRNPPGSGGGAAKTISLLNRPN